MVERYNRAKESEGTIGYKDIDLSFKTSPVTDDIRSKTDIEAVKQSIKNILFTDRGEKPFQPDFYGGLNDLLFEPIDSITASILRQTIITALRNYEPRIEIVSVDVVARPDEHELDVTIVFNMINVLEPQTINIILTRLR